METNLLSVPWCSFLLVPLGQAGRAVGLTRVCVRLRTVRCCGSGCRPGSLPVRLRLGVCACMVSFAPLNFLGTPLPHYKSLGQGVQFSLQNVRHMTELAHLRRRTNSWLIWFRGNHKHLSSLDVDHVPSENTELPHEARFYYKEFSEIYNCLNCFLSWPFWRLDLRSPGVDKGSLPSEGL